MLDHALMLLEEGAFDDTPTPVDIGSSLNPGGGHPIEVSVSCGGRDAENAVDGESVPLDITLNITTGLTEAAVGDTTVATYAITADEINAGFIFYLPVTGLLRWVTVAFTNLAAGTNMNVSLTPYGVQDAF